MSQLTQALNTQYQNVLEQFAQRPRTAAATTATVALSLSLLWVLSDFHAWKSFGTGGTPPTWAGYWRMTKIRFNRLLLFGKDNLTDPTPLSTSGPAYLDGTKIAPREGDRPKMMARTMPQRQVPYPKFTVDPGVEDRVAKLMTTFAAKYPDILELRPSKTEGGSTDAIYAKESLSTIDAKAKGNKLLGTEIAHAHPAEGSLHVWLTQRDARTVVEKGYGERFPLVFIDKGWTMVYAPRTQSEVDVVEQIVKAGIAHIAGVKV